LCGVGGQYGCGVDIDDGGVGWIGHTVSRQLFVFVVASSRNEKQKRQ
jgi:hypothetical protein